MIGRLFNDQRDYATKRNAGVIGSVFASRLLQPRPSFRIDGAIRAEHLVTLPPQRRLGTHDPHPVTKVIQEHYSVQVVLL